MRSTRLPQRQQRGRQSQGRGRRLGLPIARVRPTSWSASPNVALVLIDTPRAGRGLSVEMLLRFVDRWLKPELPVEGRLATEEGLPEP